MKRTLLLLIVCLAIGGCATKRPDLRDVRNQTCRNVNQCTVNVVNPVCGVTGCTASVDFDVTILERGKNNFRVTVVLPTGYGFCDTAGDGVWLKTVDRDEQFEKPRADKPSGTGPCKFKEFQLTAKNNKSLPDPKDWYEYKIMFHDEAGTKLYIVDPYIMNQ